MNLEESSIPDCTYTDDIVCPYCGFTHSSGDDDSNLVIGTWDCDGCGRRFNLERDYSVTYSSWKMDDKEE